jgi:hypothetical protein
LILLPGSRIDVSRSGTTTAKMSCRPLRMDLRLDDAAGRVRSERVAVADATTVGL